MDKTSYWHEWESNTIIQVYYQDSYINMITWGASRIILNVSSLCTEGESSDHHAARRMSPVGLLIDHEHRIFIETISCRIGRYIVHIQHAKVTPPRCQKLRHLRQTRTCPVRPDKYNLPKNKNISYATLLHGHEAVFQEAHSYDCAFVTSPSFDTRRVFIG